MHGKDGITIKQSVTAKYLIEVFQFMAENNRNSVLMIKLGLKVSQQTGGRETLNWNFETFHVASEHGSATCCAVFRDNDAAFPSIPLNQTDKMMEHNGCLVPTVQIHLQTKCHDS